MDVIRPIPMCHGQNMVMAYGHPTILRNPLCLMRIFSPIPGWPSPNGFISNFSWLVININVIKHYQIPNDINDSCLNPQLRKSSINPWKSMKWSHPAAAAPQALSLRSSSAALRHGAKGSSAVRAALKEITSWKLRSRGHGERIFFWWTSWTKQNVRRIFVASMILIEDKLFWCSACRPIGKFTSKSREQTCHQHQ